MKFIVTEQNYAAQVVRIPAVLNLDNSDRLQGIPLQGLHAITAKGSFTVGQLGVLFYPECQISEAFCKENNLYSNPELNADKVKGYIGDNRRVRAIKLRGHDSNCLLLSLNSLAKIGIDVSQLKEGDSFNAIQVGDKVIDVCKKYIIYRREYNPSIKAQKPKKKKEVYIEKKFIPEHIDTENWFRNEYKVDPSAFVIATAKLHGTSVRLANQPCPRRLSLLERLAKYFGIKVQETEYKYVAASRTVIKNPESSKSGFYKFDVYNAALEEVKHLIPKNYVIYGELVGWANHSAIQKNYTYRIPQGKFELYVYRIAFINADGILIDLSWDQIKKFCENTGLKHVQEMFRGVKDSLDVMKFMNKKFYELMGDPYLPLDTNAPCDEGICIRVEDGSSTPKIYKAKSPMFLGHETKMLDDGVVSLEDENGI